MKNLDSILSPKTKPTPKQNYQKNKIAFVKTKTFSLTAPKPSLAYRANKFVKNSVKPYAGILASVFLTAFGAFAPMNLAVNVATVQASYGSPVQIWWPMPDSKLTGQQPFKAMLEGADVSNYKMFWQVDDGQLNEMQNSSQDYPHKETEVDLSGWTWHGSGPYNVSFVAQDLSGKNIGSTSADIYIESPETTTTPAATTTAAPAPQPVPQTQSTAPQATAPAAQPQTQAPATTVTIPASSPTPLTINVTVKDQNGKVLGQNNVDVNILPTQNSTVTDSQPTNSSGNIFSGQKLYYNGSNDVKTYANVIRVLDNYNAGLLDKIGDQPVADWLGNWNSDVKADTNKIITAAQNQGALPTLVLYNIPNRDCGGYSSGGSSPQAYEQWVNAIAAGINNRKTAVVLEPDATALTNCLSAQDLQTRYSLLSNAVTTLKKAGASVYIDAGHPGWIPVSDMANRLKQSGIDKADGFALNVSNFTTTADNISYGQNISSLLNGKHFIVDTGRNGSGPAYNNEWCNPSGRALGTKPTTNTGNNLIDALLWVKGPGGSDGTCNGGPAAGIFWAPYAEGLAQRANW